MTPGQWRYGLWTCPHCGRAWEGTDAVTSDGPKVANLPSSCRGLSLCEAVELLPATRGRAAVSPLGNGRRHSAKLGAPPVTSVYERPSRAPWQTEPSVRTLAHARTRAHDRTRSRCDVRVPRVENHQVAVWQHGGRTFEGQLVPEFVPQAPGRRSLYHHFKPLGPSHAVRCLDAHLEAVGHVKRRARRLSSHICALWKYGAPRDFATWTGYMDRPPWTRGPTVTPRGPTTWTDHVDRPLRHVDRPRGPAT